MRIKHKSKQPLRAQLAPCGELGLNQLLRGGDPTRDNPSPDLRRTNLQYAFIPSGFFTLYDWVGSFCFVLFNHCNEILNRFSSGVLYDVLIYLTVGEFAVYHWTASDTVLE